MQIWTTPRLKNEFLLDKDLPVKLISEREIKDVFLKSALTEDIALINIDADYLDFLVKAKAKGISRPIIFISPEPTISQENLRQYSAIILDLKIGIIEVRNIVNFIIKIMMERTAAAFQFPPPDIESEDVPDERPVDSLLDIKEVLKYILKEGLSIIVAFQILEDGEPITAKGVCKIREIKDDTVVFCQFSPSMLSKGIKAGLLINAVFTHKDNDYETVMKVLRVSVNDIYISIPEKLYIAMRRNVRIEPSPKRPVTLYMLIPNEPSISLKVLNICQQGIGFITTRDLMTGGIYSFTIILPEPQSVVLCYGVIRYKKKSGSAFRYGAEFMIQPKDEEEITQYIMKRESEIIGLLTNM